jgi:hypothetical protein
MRKLTLELELLIVAESGHQESSASGGRRSGEAAEIGPYFYFG